MEVQAPTPEPTCYIPWVAGNNSDPFYVPGLKGWNEAAQQANVKTDFLGPMEMNLAAQMKVVEEVLARPDTCGVFYYPADFNAVEPFIKDAKAKGIPFIIGAADSPFKTRTAFIGYDNNVLGAQAGAWAADLIGCKGSVGTVGNASAANVTQRIQAFNDYIKATCPDVKIVQQVTHDGSAASGTSAIDSYLVANPDLSLIWFADGASGQQAGPWKDRQTQGVKTLFLATDMPDQTLEAVRDGVFVGTVGQDTYTEEFWGMLMLAEAAKGKRIPDTVYLSAILVDQANVDKWLSK